MLLRSLIIALFGCSVFFQPTKIWGVKSDFFIPANVGHQKSDPFWFVAYNVRVDWRMTTGKLGMEKCQIVLDYETHLRFRKCVTAWINWWAGTINRTKGSVNLWGNYFLGFACFIFKVSERLTRQRCKIATMLGDILGIGLNVRQTSAVTYFLSFIFWYNSWFSIASWTSFSIKDIKPWWCFIKWHISSIVHCILQECFLALLALGFANGTDDRLANTSCPTGTNGNRSITINSTKG